METAAVDTIFFHIDIHFYVFDIATIIGDYASNK